MDTAVRGKRVFAATGGRDFDRRLPTLVLVHGAGFDRTTWQLQTRYLSHHGFGVLAVDLPGHGRSEGPALDSISDIGDWIVDLLDAVDVDTAAVVGHSMGALAALSCAGRHPDRISKLAMLGVGESMPVHPELLAAAEANDQHAIDLLIGWSFGARSHRGGHPSPGTWMVGAGNRVQQRTAPDVLFNDLTACNDFSDAAALAMKVQCPSLFLLGSADKMTPPDAAQPLIEAIPDASLVLLPATGHMSPTENPNRVREVLAQFLANE